MKKVVLTTQIPRWRCTTGSGVSGGSVVASDTTPAKKRIGVGLKLPNLTADQTKLLLEEYLKRARALNPRDKTKVGPQEAMYDAWKQIVKEMEAIGVKHDAKVLSNILEEQYKMYKGLRKLGMGKRIPTNGGEITEKELAAEVWNLEICPVHKNQVLDVLMAEVVRSIEAQPIENDYPGLGAAGVGIFENISYRGSAQLSLREANEIKRLRDDVLNPSTEAGISNLRSNLENPRALICKNQVALQETIAAQLRLISEVSLREKSKDESDRKLLEMAQTKFHQEMKVFQGQEQESRLNCERIKLENEALKLEVARLKLLLSEAGINI